MGLCVQIEKQKNAGTWVRMRMECVDGLRRLLRRVPISWKGPEAV